MHGGEAGENRCGMIESDQLWRVNPAACAARWSGGAWQRARHLTYLARIIAGTLVTAKRLVVTAPVRHGKSELISLWTPVWFFANRPDAHVAVCSHGSEFARRWGRRVQDTLEQNPEIGVRVRPDVSAQASWETTATGEMHTVGTGGSITGRGFDLIVVDDPVKDMADGFSAHQRDLAWEWFEGTLNSRLEGEGSIIVLMSRWHRDDMVGRLLAGEGEPYEVVHLDALCETEEDPLGRQVGEALWPEKWPVARLDRRRQAVGSVTWNAQYQGRPGDPKGRLFLRNYWRHCGADELAGRGGCARLGSGREGRRQPVGGGADQILQRWPDFDQGCGAFSRHAWGAGPEDRHGGEAGRADDAHQPAERSGHRRRFAGPLSADATFGRLQRGGFAGEGRQVRAGDGFGVGG